MSDNGDNDGDDGYAPEYEVETIRIGEDYKFEVLSVVPPPLEYLASLHSNYQEISGRKVWTGSVSLANTLLHLSEESKKSIFKGKRILELGSGTGILGMAIARMSIPNHTPYAIALTDGDEIAVNLLQKNLNNPNNYINISSSSLVQASRLLWGTPINQDFYDWCQQTWHTFHDNNSPIIEFDSIFAGDVLYKKELPSLFFSTAFTLLSKHSESSLWLCHIPRHGVLHSMVVEAAEAAGFVVTTIDTKMDHLLDGCELDDLHRAVTYRIFINKNRI